MSLIINKYTVNILANAHGPLIGKVLKKGVGSYTNYRNDKDSFVTFPQKWGGLLCEHGLLSGCLRYSLSCYIMY